MKLGRSIQNKLTAYYEMPVDICMQKQTEKGLYTQISVKLYAPLFIMMKEHLEGQILLP